VTCIVLIRHGQTHFNERNRVRGQLDPELSEEGLRHAQLTGEYVASRWPVAAVYTSPLRRAGQTAEAVARAQGLLPTPIQALLDLNFGEWQGISFDEARERFPALHRAWRDAPHTVRFPGGESLADVRARITVGVDEIVSRHAEDTVAMVGHTVVNRVLLCAVLGLGDDGFWRLGQDTCAVNVISVANDGKKTLVLLNDTSHLYRACCSAIA
jgi:probable phosphoglycerate mutase